MESDIEILNQKIWSLAKPNWTSANLRPIKLDAHICDTDASVRKLTIIYLGHSISVADYIDRNYATSDDNDKQIHQSIRNAHKFIINDLSHLSGITLRQQCINIITNIKHDFKGLSNLLIINPTYNSSHLA